MRAVAPSTPSSADGADTAAKHRRRDAEELADVFADDGDGSANRLGTSLRSGRLASRCAGDCGVAAAAPCAIAAWWRNGA